MPALLPALRPLTCAIAFILFCVLRALRAPTSTTISRFTGARFKTILRTLSLTALLLSLRSGSTVQVLGLPVRLSPSSLTNGAQQHSLCGGWVGGASRTHLAAGDPDRRRRYPEGFVPVLCSHASSGRLPALPPHRLPSCRHFAGRRRGQRQRPSGPLVGSVSPSYQPHRRWRVGETYRYYPGPGPHCGLCRCWGRVPRSSGRLPHRCCPFFPGASRDLSFGLRCFEAGAALGRHQCSDRSFGLSDRGVRAYGPQAGKGTSEAEAADSCTARLSTRGPLQSRGRNRRAAVFSSGVGGGRPCSGPGSTSPCSWLSQPACGSCFEPPCAATRRPESDSTRTFGTPAKCPLPFRT